MKLGIVYGGKSTESKISIASAYEFSQWIDYNQHIIVPIYIDSKGAWNIGKEKKSPFDSLIEMTACNLFEESSFLKKGIIDVAIPLLSGVYGEDGTIQGFFEILDVPYTGNGVESSAISMNKILTKRLLESYGIQTVEDLAINVFEWENESQEILKKIEMSLEYPLFIKPARLGSSIGISKVGNSNELLKAINKGFEYDLDLLIEKGIDMQEINVSVLQNKNKLIVSKPGKIISQNDFYSYEDKYSEDSTAIKEKANLSKEQENELTSLSETIFKGLNARGLMRIDYFINKKGEIYLNEVNTLPSLGGTSVFPFLLNETGVSNENIVEYLIETTLYLKQKKDRLNYFY